jgi:hypothetical protein
LGKKSNLKEATAIFVEETKGSYIPYFLETAKAKDEEETFVKLEGIDSKEAAARFTAKQVWLLDADFRQLAGKDAPISLLGYEVITDEDENLGPIEEVIEQFSLQKVTFRTYMGLFLFPVTLMLFYSDYITNFIIYSIIIILLTINLLAYFISLKIYQNFIFSKFFYFILYLCALEIAPYYFIYYLITKN